METGGSSINPVLSTNGDGFSAPGSAYLARAARGAPHKAKRRQFEERGHENQRGLRARAEKKTNDSNKGRQWVKVSKDPKNLFGAWGWTPPL